MKSYFIWSAVAVVLVLFVIPFIVTLFVFLRYAVFPIKMARLGEQPELNAVKRAALSEIEKLGFRTVDFFKIEEGSVTYLAAILRHDAQHLLALVTFRAVAAMSGYPVSFWSFLSDGKLITTTNRHAAGFPMPNAEIHRVFAPDLPSQLQLHQKNIAGRALDVTTDEEASGRMVSAMEEFFAHGERMGIIRSQDDRGVISLKHAAGMTIAAMRKRRAARRPYVTPETSSAFRSAYGAELYETFESVRERTVKRPWLIGLTFFLSLILSYGLFSAVLGQVSAVAIILVLLVHETGHAIAMRYFGYKDMSMFFVPFMGAVVTGKVQNISTWKQMVILFAGPVPGLIFALISIHFHGLDHLRSSPTLLAHLTLFALTINLFNLLPISFLDGGRILEISLLSRWPYALFCFWVLGVVAMAAIAIGLDSKNLFPLVFIMAMGAKNLWRMAGLKRLWARERLVNGDLTHLFDVLNRSPKPVPLQRQYQIARAIYAPSLVRKPKPWETALSLGLYLLIWLPICFYGYNQWHMTETRKAFDAAYYRSSQTSEAARLIALETVAASLDASDPRQVDLQVLEARTQEPALELPVLDNLIKERKEGRNYKRGAIVSLYLRQKEASLAGESPEAWEQSMQEAVAHIEEIAPEMFGSTVEARLDLAEFYDKHEDSAKARRNMDDLLKRSAHADACDCALSDVSEANAWYFIDRGDAPAAVDFLEHSIFANKMKMKNGVLSQTYAWALLENNSFGPGLEQMIKANGDPDDDPEFDLDLIYAYRKTGHLKEAEELINQPDNQYACRSDVISDLIPHHPWQKRRQDAITAAVTETCAERSANEETPKPGQ